MTAPEVTPVLDAWAAISTTRTDEQLAEHEAHLVELAMRIRGGDHDRRILRSASGRECPR